MSEQDKERARIAIEHFIFDEQGFEPPSTHNEKIAHAGFINTVAKSIADARSDLARKVLNAIRPIADRDHAGEECLYAVRDLFTREQIDLGDKK